MAAKRLRDGSDKDSDKPEEESGPKKLRALPSFSTLVQVKTLLLLFTSSTTFELSAKAICSLGIGYLVTIF